MDWTKVAEWIANQGLALAVAAVAAWAALWAVKVTRAYQDPLFVMECEPRHIPAAPAGEPSQPVKMYLVNRGNSFAKDVQWVANYDPYGVAVPLQSWPLIEGKGGRVSVVTPFVAGSMSMGVIGLLVSRKDGAAYATVTFVTQSGHTKTEQVLLPDPRHFSTDLPEGT